MFTARLANFVSGTPSPQIPKDVRRYVGIAFIDTVGGSLAVSGKALVDGAPQEAAPYGGLANAIVLGHDLNLAAPALCPGQQRATGIGRGLRVVASPIKASFERRRYNLSH